MYSAFIPICLLAAKAHLSIIVDSRRPWNGAIEFSRNDAVVMNPIWRMQNGQGPSWRYAQAKIDPEVNFQVSQKLSLYIKTSTFSVSKMIGSISEAKNGGSYGRNGFSLSCV